MIRVVAAVLEVVGVGLLLVGLWWLAPWVALVAGGALSVAAGLMLEGVLGGDGFVRRAGPPPPA